MATEEEPPAPVPAPAAEEAAPAPPPAAVIDPCDPKRLMFDSIDLLAYEIITNPSKRAERKGQLEVGLILFACVCLCRINLSVPLGFGGEVQFASKLTEEGGGQPCVYIQCSDASPCISYKFHYSFIYFSTNKTPRSALRCCPNSTQRRARPDLYDPISFHFLSSGSTSSIGSASSPSTAGPGPASAWPSSSRTFAAAMPISSRTPRAEM